MATSAIHDSEHNVESQSPDYVDTLVRRYKINRRTGLTTSGVNLQRGDPLPEDATYQIANSQLGRGPGNSDHWIEVTAVKDKVWTA